MMNALILGASGLVGGNCMSHFKKLGWNVLGTHFSFETSETLFFNTLDLNDPRNIDLNSFKPQVIIHCGALTWVDYCEEHPEESFQKTVESTLNAIKLAQSFNAQLVYLSTDYVFDGAKGFYTEIDETNPLSIYGKHKLEAEQAVVSSIENHLICRITNVYGNELRGKNFVARLSENLKSGKSITLDLPLDQYATPVNAADVARAIAHLVSDKHNGIFHFASTDYLNRVQLAKRVAKYFSHKDFVINGMSTKEMNQPAARPLNGGFNAHKFNTLYPNFNWSNLDDYLHQLID